MRVLLKQIFAVILVAVMVLIPGCTLINGFKDSSGNKKNQTEFNNTKKQEIENSITIGVVELDTYNPLTTKSTTTQNMLGFIFEPLFALDSNHKTSGVLAQSYQTAPDGKSIVINLKQNVIWHDGTPFTANDVAYTINAILNNETSFKKLLSNVESVSKINDQSVSIQFERSVPNPVLLLSFPIIKNGSFSDNFNPIGTGPFYLDYDKLSAFTPYHGSKPKLDYVLVKSIPDNEKFFSLFNASVIDIADSSMVDMTEYTPRSNATVCNYVSDDMVFVGFNTEDSVFKYPEARRSVYEIIDRQNIVSHIYFSRAQAAHYPMNPTNRFYPSSVENMNSDHGAAEKELTTGKWQRDKRGVYYHADERGATYFSVEILVNSEDKDRVKIAAEISETMDELGMKNTVVTCSESEFSTRILNGNYDMFVGKTSLLPNNDLTDILSGNNMLNYTNKKTDILLSQLGTLTVENDKKAVYTELFEHIKEECPIAPICFLKQSVIMSAKIKSGVSPSVSGRVLRTENWSVK